LICSISASGLNFRKPGGSSNDDADCGSSLMFSTAMTVPFGERLHHPMNGRLARAVVGLRLTDQDFSA
jgi:hypothetical protein